MNKSFKFFKGFTKLQIDGVYYSHEEYVALLEKSRNDMVKLDIMMKRIIGGMVRNNNDSV